MVFKNMEQFEREVNKFVEAKRRSIKEHTEALEKAKADKLAAKEAADKAVAADNIEAYRKAVEAGTNADFYIQLHTKKLELLNKPAEDMPAARDVKLFLEQRIADMDATDIAAYIETADKIRITGQAASDKVIKARRLYRLYCENVAMEPDQVNAGVLVSRSVALAENMLRFLPEYRTAKGINPTQPIIKTTMEW